MDAGFPAALAAVTKADGSTVGVAVGKGNDAEDEGEGRFFLAWRVGGVGVGKRLDVGEIYLLAHGVLRCVVPLVGIALSAVAIFA